MQHCVPIALRMFENPPPCVRNLFVMHLRNLETYLVDEKPDCKLNTEHLDNNNYDELLTAFKQCCCTSLPAAAVEVLSSVNAEAFGIFSMWMIPFSPVASADFIELCTHFVLGCELVTVHTTHLGFLKVWKRVLVTSLILAV